MASALGRKFLGCRCWVARGGCVTGCVPSSSSSGGAGGRSTARCEPWAQNPALRDRWRPTAVAGGATARCCSAACSPLRDSTGWITPSVMTSTSRTARCGPACRVVWEGSVQRWAAPIPMDARFWCLRFSPASPPDFHRLAHSGPVRRRTQPPIMAADVPTVADPATDAATDAARPAARRPATRFASVRRRPQRLEVPIDRARPLPVLELDGPQSMTQPLV